MNGEDQFDTDTLRAAERAARERYGLDHTAAAPPRIAPILVVPSGAALRAAEQNAQSEAERAERIERERAERAVQDALACVPAAFAGLTIDGPELPKRIRRSAVILEARAAQNDPGIVFMGPAGAGKSSLASALMRAVVAAESGSRSCAWIPARKLAHARRGHPLGEGEPPLVVSASRVGLLVLDDLGGEDVAYASAVADVICDRYDAALVTWVTTGFEAKDISARYGAMVARRVFQRSTAIRCEKATESK